MNNDIVNAWEEIKAALVSLDCNESNRLLVCLSKQPLEVCANALEKQIPHKLSPESNEGGKIPVCGKCNGYMDLLQGNLDYCPNCGQAIDWSDEE